MEVENWKVIDGYPNYEVSSCGKVMNVKFGKILKPEIFEAGYYRICLRKDGIKKHHLIHRLVGKSFIPTEDYTLQINHIDGNKSNNHFANLEWVTPKYNIHHGISNGLINPGHTQRKPINQLTLDGCFIKEWKSIMDVERELGIHSPSISAVALGKRKHAGGFNWQYKNR